MYRENRDESWNTISIFQADNVKLIHLTNFTEKFCCACLFWIQTKFLECRPFEKKFKFFIWTMRAEFELLWNSHFKDTILNPLVFHVPKFTFGASIKYVHSKREGGVQDIVFMTSFYGLKAYNVWGVSENPQIRAYVLYGWPHFKSYFKLVFELERFYCINSVTTLNYRTCK